MASVSSGATFRFRNSCFLVRFLLSVDGLAFFLFFSTTVVVAVPLVSRENEKPEARVRLKVKTWIWSVPGRISGTGFPVEAGLHPSSQARVTSVNP